MIRRKIFGYTVLFPNKNSIFKTCESAIEQYKI